MQATYERKRGLWCWLMVLSGQVQYQVARCFEPLARLAHLVKVQEGERGEGEIREGWGENGPGPTIRFEDTQNIQ